MKGFATKRLSQMLNDLYFWFALIVGLIVAPLVLSGGVIVVALSRRWRQYPVVFRGDSRCAMCRSDAVGSGPARAPPRGQWCGPLRSSLRFNHPPALLGQGGFSLAMPINTKGDRLRSLRNSRHGSGALPLQR